MCNYVIKVKILNGIGIFELLFSDPILELVQILIPSVQTYLKHLYRIVLHTFFNINIDQSDNKLSNDNETHILYTAKPTKHFSV